MRSLTLFALLAFAVNLVGSGCASRNPRGRSLAGEGELAPPDFRGDLVEGLRATLKQIEHSYLDNGTCVPYLRLLEANIHGIDPAKLPAGYLERNAPALIDLTWKSQLALHRRLPEFDEDCVKQARDTFRLFRFVIDYVAERAAKAPSDDPSAKGYFEKSPTPFLDKSPYFLVLPADASKAISFVPGDLMIARGVSFLSAIIARVGDVESQYSHIVFVDQDARKQPQTIESYVGVGVKFYDLKTALKNENPRLLLLRSKDADLAARAARFMHDEVQGRIDRGQKPIPYDYAFDFDEHSALSCAEVARYAYEAASDKRVIIPRYETNLSLDQEFLDRFALKHGKTFEPADMEADPRFDIVAEFRDLRLTRDSRIKDVILSEMVRWVREENYHFAGSSKGWMASHIAYPIRRTPLWPLFKRVTGTDDFSKDIPKEQLATFAMLGQVGDALLAHLRAADAAFEKKTGWPMTYLQLREDLEAFRKSDLAVYSNKKTAKKAAFHRIFRPKGL